MPIRRSQDKERPEVARARVGNDEHRTGIEGCAPPAPPPLKEPDKRCPKTGKFIEGNQAARMREIKRAAKFGLDPKHCVPWLRPYAGLVRLQASSILADLPAQNAMLGALAVDAATSLAIGRAMLALGGEHGAYKVLKEARAWIREHRTGVIALVALARDEARARNGQHGTSLEALGVNVEFARELLARKAEETDDDG